MLWKSDVVLSLLSYSMNHVDMEVEGLGNYKWRLTGYYKHLERHNRWWSWSLIHELARRSSIPWLIWGDFNDLLHFEEKVGGNVQPDWMLRDFNEAFEACGLTKVPMVGGSFTWRRGKNFEKLDRGLTSASWKRSFPWARVWVLPSLSSDHNPL